MGETLTEQDTNIDSAITGAASATKTEKVTVPGQAPETNAAWQSQAQVD